MQKVKNNLTSMRRLMLGTGKVSSIVQCAFSALLYSYTQMLSMPAYFIIPAVLLAIALPLLVMPLIYDFISNIKNVSTGRYHLVYVLLTLMLGITITFLFGINKNASFSFKAIALFFSLMLSVLFYLVYVSVFSSIAIRICEKNKSGTIFSFIGVAILIAALIFINSTESYSEFGYICGCVIVITGFCVYLVSSTFMPAYIRVEQSKKRTLFNKYNKFFSSFSTKENRRAYIIFFLMCISVQIVAMTALSLKEFVSSNNFHVAICAVILLFCAVASAVISRFMRKNNAMAVIIMACCCAVPLILFIVASFFTLSTSLSFLLMLSFSILYGIGTGLFYAISNQIFEEIYDRSSTTKVTLVNIKNMLFFAGLVIAFVAVCVAGLFLKFFILISLAVSLIFLLAALIIRIAKKRYLTLDYPEGLDDLGFKN